MQLNLCSVKNPKRKIFARIYQSGLNHCLFVFGLAWLGGFVYSFRFFSILGESNCFELVGLFGSNYILCGDAGNYGAEFQVPPRLAWAGCFDYFGGEYCLAHYVVYSILFRAEWDELWLALF